MTFDPHERHFGESGQSSGGIQLDFNNDSDKFESNADQFAPFRIFTKDLGLDLKNEFNGTLFRFPIRTQPSELCADHPPPIDELIREILNSFLEDLRLLLVFLRNLERVEVYEIARGSRDFRLLASTWIDLDESSPDLKKKRVAYRKALLETVDAGEKTMSEKAFQFDDVNINFKMVVRSKIEMNNDTPKESLDRYLISNYVRLKSASRVSFYKKNNSLYLSIFFMFVLRICKN